MPMKLLLTILCIPAVLLLGAAEASGADFQKGLEAFEAGDYAVALRELRPLAKQGDAQAQYTLGAMYEKGQGVAQDDTQALKWYRKAAEQGHAQAQFLLGLMHEKGQGVVQVVAQGMKWCREAAGIEDNWAHYAHGVDFQGIAREDDTVMTYVKRFRRR